MGAEKFCAGQKKKKKYKMPVELDGGEVVAHGHCSRQGSMKTCDGSEQEESVVEALSLEQRR